MNKTAIIGAGIAGLACANVLKDAGHDVCVFDKGRGPGGRMSTRRAMTNLGEASFDHGAQYFTARDPDFAATLNRLTTQGAAAQWTGDLVKLDKDGRASPLANEALYVGKPGMNNIVRALGKDITIAWATRVEKIERDGDHWHLIAEQGQDLGLFDDVICAVPAEQVAPLLETIAPAFAQSSIAINSLPCWAALFAFERALCIPFDAMRLEGNEMIDFIAMNHSKPDRAGPPAYVVHATPDWSARHLEKAPEAIANHLRDALLSFSDDRPALVFETAHRWRFARVEVSNGPGFLWDDAKKLGACGDWLSGPRVESAWLSGHHLGQAIVKARHAGE